MLLCFNVQIVQIKINCLNIVIIISTKSKLKNKYFNLKYCKYEIYKINFIQLNRMCL